jgi:hypothetical protein
MTYEPPTIIEVGNVREVTMGNLFATGQDAFNTVLAQAGYGGPNLFGS